MTTTTTSAATKIWVKIRCIQTATFVPSYNFFILVFSFSFARSVSIKLKQCWRCFVLFQSHPPIHQFNSVGREINKMWFDIGTSWKSYTAFSRPQCEKFSDSSSNEIRVCVCVCVRGCFSLSLSFGKSLKLPRECAPSNSEKIYSMRELYNKFPNILLRFIQFAFLLLRFSWDFRFCFPCAKYPYFDRSHFSPIFKVL